MKIFKPGCPALCGGDLKAWALLVASFQSVFCIKGEFECVIELEHQRIFREYHIWQTFHFELGFKLLERFLPHDWADRRLDFPRAKHKRIGPDFLRHFQTEILKEISIDISESQYTVISQI